MLGIVRSTCRANSSTYVSPARQREEFVIARKQRYIYRVIAAWDLNYDYEVSYIVTPAEVLLLL